MMRNLLNSLILTVIFIGFAQVVQAQTDNSALLKKLIKVTSEGHPFRQDLPDWIKPPSPDPAKVAEKFDPVIAENTQLTADQKQFVKANYDKLAGLVNQKMIAVTGKHIKFSGWLTTFLNESYSKELTPDEMRSWLAFFEQSEGQTILKSIFSVPQPTDAESQALLQKFEKTPIGIKFIKIFGADLDALIQAKMSEVEPTIKEEYQKILAPAELNKLFNQFVAENFKK